MLEGWELAGGRRMRKAVLVVVLAIHMGFFFLFAVFRSPAPRSSDREARSIAFFLSLTEPRTPSEPAQSRSATPATGPRNPKRVPPLAKSPHALAPPQSQPQSQAITPTAPDWRQELQIAANNQLASAEKKRREPAVLAPHDFSGVQPGSTDDSRREFGWDHSATHRVEEIPGGGLLININERCAIAWVIFPFPVCKIGKIPPRGDLFDHMKDAPEARP